LKNQIPLFVSLKAAKSDPALQLGGRGARKIGVTVLYEGKEKEYDSATWNGVSAFSPVMTFQETEYAVFNEITFQDRHYHKLGTEFYTVLEGIFTIDVENILYTLGVGDTIIIPTGVVHEVLRHTSFTANVITVGCGGVSDKYIVEK